MTHEAISGSPELRTISGDVAAEVHRLKQEPGRDIWLCGGGELAAQLIDEIDEVQVKINPLLLGRGVPLIPFEGAARRLALVGVERLPGGVILATYARA